MKHSHFIEFLSLRLQQPLPGWDSHKKMSPLINGAIPIGYTKIPQEAKKSAAAILLYPKSDESELLLISNKYISKSEAFCNLISNLT